MSDTWIKFVSHKYAIFRYLIFQKKIIKYWNIILNCQENYQILDNNSEFRHVWLLSVIRFYKTFWYETHAGYLTNESFHFKNHWNVWRTRHGVKLKFYGSADQELKLISKDRNLITIKNMVTKRIAMSWSLLVQRLICALIVMLWGFHFRYTKRYH